MTIQTKLPSSIRTPGAYSDFDFNAGKLSLIDVDLRIVAIGEMMATGTAAVEVPVQAFSEADADAKFGIGSPAALMVRGAIAQQGLSEPSASIWVCPVAEPGGGTKAITTLTFTGPATEAGNIELEVAGVTFLVGVSNGDSANTIAAAAKAAFDALKPVLPVTAGVAGAVVSGTATTKGVNGNDVFYRCNKKPAGVGLVIAQTVAGAGAAVIVNALGALYGQPYAAIAISNHTAADIAVLLTDAATAWGYNQKSYRDYFVGENGSTSTAETLEAAANDYRIHVGNCEQTGTIPGVIAMGLAAAEYSREAPNANLDGEAFIAAPPPATYAFTAAEVEALIAGGVIPIVPDGQRTKIVTMITTQISYLGAPYENLRDTANHRTMAYGAKQVELNYERKFKQATGDANFLANVRDMVIDVQRLMETAGYIRDVDDLLDDTKAAWAFPNSSRRVTIANPMRVAGPVHQAAILNQMYL